MCLTSETQTPLYENLQADILRPKRLTSILSNPVLSTLISSNENSFTNIKQSKYL